ncbi:MAG: ABC transporter ATP-binding protein [Phycisphaerae bacterium]
MTGLIEIENANKTYRNHGLSVHAVRGVSLSVAHGEFIAITGASGSGKSTFMHLLGCLDQLTSGSYRLEGRETSTLNKKQLAKLRNDRIGFVFQAFNLLSRTTIVDNVALPLLYQGVRRAERRKRAAEMLDRVGLGDRLQHLSNQLSGGQQQRVAVARALITKAPMILADEPTGNLDTKTSHEIMNLFRALNRDEGVCVILVTHEPEIADYADRHVKFRDGIIIEDTGSEISSSAHPQPDGKALFAAAS